MMTAATWRRASRTFGNVTGYAVLPTVNIRVFIAAPARASRCLRRADAERVGDPIDVVEPRGDERDLQDAAVVEARGAQLGVVLIGDRSGIERDLFGVLEHDAIGFCDRRGAKVSANRFGQLVIARRPAQELGV